MYHVVVLVDGDPVTGREEEVGQVVEVVGQAEAVAVALVALEEEAVVEAEPVEVGKKYKKTA